MKAFLIASSTDPDIASSRRSKESSNPSVPMTAVEHGTFNALPLDIDVSIICR
nr:hypothetical protein [Brucella sp. NBRC 12950]